MVVRPGELPRVLPDQLPLLEYPPLVVHLKLDVKKDLFSPRNPYSADPRLA